MHATDNLIAPKTKSAIARKESGNMNSSSFSTINPATGAPIETFPFFNAKETEAALVRAEKSFKSYRKMPMHHRAELLSKLATTLRKNKAHLAKVITMEMGKILSEADAEVEKCAWEADWYAEHGPQMLADAPAPTGRVEAYVSYLPLGPILGIMPWNFPLWQMTRMGIPTMLAGNVVLPPPSCRFSKRRTYTIAQQCIGIAAKKGLRRRIQSLPARVAPSPPVYPT